MLGTGTVGAAFVARYQRLQSRGLALPKVAWLANSRSVQACGSGLDAALEQAIAAPRRELLLQGWAEAEALHEGDIVVDATASELVADWHPEWLVRGVSVVTANKLGHGSLLARSQAITEAQCATGARYGDSATVGAGLPLLGSLRALVAGGDRIHAVEGVLSGSLGWLFGRFDGTCPFSDCVREAAAAGYTEPDPRVDLSGEDVRRKLLILARAAGLALEPAQVRVESLLPAALAAAAPGEVDGLLHLLDAPLAARLQQARDTGGKLRFVGRFDAHGATVGLRTLPADHPLCGGSGADNRVAVSSDRYPVQPLVIQGPGAGAEVTAAALLDDVLRISAA
ncbi:homoserine dehydrogenase [Pseudoxanthomonas koreensis]|uniref:homoserine dehydrogenase n=1 Tax=Pseudoxanthomonas koreensis TaxID=266061 RepID=UPI0013916301|nr:homoserine dehydrogenase [Pseudoxanthomonas koreensis]KAF1696666.1 homoserine dehydrogenase [Pseudoxanthomonas koreensis]